MKTVIGISGSILINQGGSFTGYKRAYVNHDYVLSVLRAGAVPFIIPFNEDMDATREMVSHIDGLILSGGHDVDPIRYGEDIQMKCGETFPERDDFDTMLYKTAIELKKPVLGICRGFQLMNVIEGGSLYQDLSYADFKTLKHDQGDGPSRMTQTISIERGSFLEKAWGSVARVNSFHHQIIKDVAKGFKVVARTSDGVVEAIEKEASDTLVVGVQFHPEMLSGVKCGAQNIFNALVEAATKNK